MATNRWLIGLSLLAAGGLVGVAAFIRIAGPMVTGFFAKNLCSGVFVASRDARRVVEDDLFAYSPAPLFRLIRWRVDTRARLAEAWIPGIARQSAVHRPGDDCARVVTATDALPAKATTAAIGLPAGIPIERAAGGERESNRDWDAARLSAAIDAAFVDPPGRSPRRTRAVVVLWQGRLIAERYAPGHGPDTRFPGWSMAKSVVGALAGVMVERGLWRIDEPLGNEAWNDAGDPRRTIRIDHALSMSTGLAFSEDYAKPWSDVNRMLWTEDDAAAYAAARPLQAPPGTRFEYTSGTSNLLVAAMERRLGTRIDDFARTALFEPLGMGSAVLGHDPSGRFVGSSFLFATARDWARFGQFHLDDGVVDGRRILPPGWVGRATAANGVTERYGWHWWRAEPPDDGPLLPRDAFQATGHGGQRITVLPEHRLVIVRLGHTLDRSVLGHRELIDGIVGSLRPARQSGSPASDQTASASRVAATSWTRTIDAPRATATSASARLEGNGESARRSSRLPSTPLRDRPTSSG